MILSLARFHEKDYTFWFNGRSINSHNSYILLSSCIDDYINKSPVPDEFMFIINGFGSDVIKQHLVMTNIVVLGRQPGVILLYKGTEDIGFFNDFEIDCECSDTKLILKMIL